MFRICPSVSLLLVLVVALASMTSDVVRAGTNNTLDEYSQVAYDTGSTVGLVEVATNQSVDVPGVMDTSEATGVVAKAAVSKGRKKQKRIKNSNSKKGKKPAKNSKKKKRDVSSGSPNTSWRTTGLTFFGQSRADDNGIGITGVDLFRYGNSGIRYRGERVYPCAVFQGDASRYLYKVLEVTSSEFRKSKTVYLHVVDACNSGQQICRTNVRRHGGFLIDIHETATEEVGVDDGLLKGSFRVVGEIGPNELPKKVWKNAWRLCGCRGACKGGDMRWRHGRC